MKRAIIYARVSTDEQADNYSLPSQIELCRKYAERLSLELVGEQYYKKEDTKLVKASPDDAGAIPAYVDDYSGATPIEQRPEGRKAYAMLKVGNADALISLSVDRIVRPPEEGDEWDMPILIRGLAKLGKEIHTTVDGQLKTDFISLLSVVFKAKSAGEERRNILERMMRGKRFKAQDGKVTGGGVAPFGYHIVRDKKLRPLQFKIYNREARIVRMIFDWYVNHHYSIMRIIRELAERRIPTPGERKGNFRRKRESGIWSAGVIHRLLTSEIYVGIWAWNRRDGTSGKFKDAREHIRINVPAIIDRETWNRAQTQREYNRLGSPRNAKREYLMRGLLSCSCGCAFVGHFQNAHKYYICARRSNHEPHVEKIPCRARAVRASAVETIAWESITQFFKNIPELKRLLHEAQVQEAQTQEPLLQELESYKELLKECDRDAADCAAAIRRTKGRVRTKLEAEHDRINARYEDLQKKCAEIEAKLADRTYTDRAIADTLHFAEDVDRGWSNPSGETMRYYFERLGVKIVITSPPGEQPRYHLKCILGEWDGDLPMPKLNWQMREERQRIASQSSKPS